MNDMIRKTIARMIMFMAVFCIFGFKGVETRAATSYDIWICGEQVTDEWTVLNHQAAYDVSTKTLTLKNYSSIYHNLEGYEVSNGCYAALYTKINGITINIEGLNNLKLKDYGCSNCYGIYCDKLVDKCEINGDGKLELWYGSPASTASYGIYMEDCSYYDSLDKEYKTEGLSIKGGIIRAWGTVSGIYMGSTPKTYGVYIKNGYFRQTGGELEAEGSTQATEGSYGIYMAGDMSGRIFINGGKLEAEGNPADNGNNADSESIGIYTPKGMTVSGNSNALACGDVALNKSYGVYSGGNIIVSGGSLNCEGSSNLYGQKIARSCYGVYLDGDHSVQVLPGVKMFAARGDDACVYGLIKNSVKGVAWTIPYEEEGDISIDYSEAGQRINYERVAFPKNITNNGSGSSGDPANDPSPVLYDNKPMNVSTENRGDYQITYAHGIPFAGKNKLTVNSFGDDFRVSQNEISYKVKKIKVNKKKHKIQITGLEGADKDTIKKVKNATKGNNGLPYVQNPYYVGNTDSVTPGWKKDGSLKSVKIKIGNKDYKAKKKEWEYNKDTKVITFKGDNLSGSYQAS